MGLKIMWTVRMASPLKLSRKALRACLCNVARQNGDHCRSYQRFRGAGCAVIPRGEKAVAYIRLVLSVDSLFLTHAWVRCPCRPHQSSTSWTVLAAVMSPVDGDWRHTLLQWHRAECVSSRTSHTREGVEKRSLVALVWKVVVSGFAVFMG